MPSRSAAAQTNHTTSRMVRRYRLGQTRLFRLVPVSKARDEPGRVRCVCLEIGTELRQEKCFLAADDGGICQQECADDEDGERQGAGGEADSGKSDQRKEVKGMAAQGVRSGSDESRILVSADVERTPQAAHDCDAIRNQPAAPSSTPLKVPLCVLPVAKASTKNMATKQREAKILWCATVDPIPTTFPRVISM